MTRTRQCSATDPGNSPLLATRVLDILSDGTGFTDADLARLLNVSHEDLSRAIGALYRRGLVDRCEGYIAASAAVPRPAVTATDAPRTPPTPAEPDGKATPVGDRQRLLWAATGLAERGWRVFPCQPGGKRPALRSDWERRATTDTARIARCWETGPYNIGIACGPSALTVIDLDTPKPGQGKPPEWEHDSGIRDGADVLAALCEHHRQPWPSGTFTVTTPSGGTHLYFTTPPGTQPRNTAGRLGWLIDTRAVGGYILGPGSVINGARYAIADPVAPVPLPAWLAGQLADPAPPTEVTGPAFACEMDERQSTGYALAALRGEVDRVLAAAEGTRNATLNEAAFALGQLAAAGMLPARLAYDALMRAAATIGLPPREASRTIGSGLRSGTRKPRRAA